MSSEYWALGSLFIASCDSQGYCGGTRNRLHAGDCTDRSRAASLSQVDIWDPWPNIYYCRTFSRCKAPSLTIGRVCNLLVELLLCLARVVALGAKSHRTLDHILHSHLRLSQLGGSGPCIYIPQEQGDPVIPPGTGFPLRRLLRLAGLRWRYSNQPPPLICLAYKTFARTVQKIALPTVILLLHDVIAWTS
jgi:hypothetical protein